MQLAQFANQLAVIFRLDQHQQSESERAYYVNAERGFRFQMTKILVVVGLAFHVLCVFIDSFMADDAARQVLTWTHVYVIAFGAPSFFVLRHRTSVIRPWLILNMVGQLAAQAFVLYLVCQTSDVVPLKSVAVYMVMVIVVITLCPYGGAVPSVIAVIATLFGVLAVGGSPVAVRWDAILVMGAISSLVVQRYMIVQTLNSARAEFRTMLLMAPAHVVKRSLGNRESLEDSFRPERRLCACISLNWVDYESLVYRLPQEDISALLDAYYALVDRLLGECISDGAFYCDVMVDEMFIVVFDQHGGDTPDSLRDAFTFCRRLLEERSGAAQSELRRARVDVGLSYGEALVGIMGPQQHRKTTGLGELPGRAARLKGAAQLIRRAHGTADRIVLDAGSAERLGVSTLKVFTLSEGRTLRDLDVSTLHYWERAA